MENESRGRLVLSIDLELLARAGSYEHERQLDAITGRLLELLHAYHLPATFAVADPLHSAATELITASPLAHELAVLGDASWIGRGAGRERFGRELDRRFHSARAAGLPVSSLVLRQVELAENFDLLSRHPITAIRSGTPSTTFAQPHLLRHGVWHMPTTMTLPLKTRWYQSPARIAGRVLEQAARTASVAHLAIDAGRLVETQPCKIGEIERVLSHAASLREQGKLDVVTLAGLTRLLDRPTEALAMRSILRAA